MSEQETNTKAVSFDPIKIVANGTKEQKNRRIDYTIIPKKFWEVTGYVWTGKE